jgi:hypothetical protein
MKKTLLLVALSLCSTGLYATPERGNSIEVNAGAKALGGTGTGGDSDTRNNLLMLPSTTSSMATSGNVNIVCPVISVVSKSSAWGWGAHSKAEIAVEPARINYICVYYHNAVQSGLPEDWKRFVDYAEAQEKAGK